jgi:hypothetical protein
MKAFLLSNAGKGTIGVCLTCLILVWPLVATWLVAGLTLFFAVHHLREAFRRLDADAADTTPVVMARVVAEHGAVRPCDIEYLTPVIETPCPANPTFTRKRGPYVR